MIYQTLDLSELIYEAEIQFTEIVDFGVSMEAITSGEIAVPAAGARYDQVFEGVLLGPKLKGKISGIDYLYVRADGSFQLHLHGRIRTEDGTNISLSSEGVSIQITGEGETQIRSAVALFSSSETYQWLNKLQLWAVGTLDPIKMRAFIRAYVA